MTIAELHKEFLNSEGVCTDSRKITPGTIYFALKGESFDGNDYAINAVQNGCKLAVVDQNSLAGTNKMLVVESALKTLQDLAAYHRKQKNIKILAITGSNGKTTTKELAAAVLMKRYKVLYTVGNLNNHIGVPLTLLNIKDEEFGVIEMGANHIGEIEALSDIASPDYGLITNIGKAHLEGFGSVDGVLEAKSELYHYLRSHDKKAFLNLSNSLLAEKTRSLGLSCIPYNDDKIGVEIEGVYPGLQCRINMNGRLYSVKTKLVGAYNLENIAAAVAVALHFEVADKDIVEAIENYAPESQRSQLIRGKRNTIVLDAYNANPSSMKESVTDFLNYTSGPKMLILGDMFELGHDEEAEHHNIISWLSNQKLEKVLFVGGAFKKAGEAFQKFKYFPDVASCISYLKEANPRGHHILIKGSRKMALETTTIHLID